MPNTFKKIVELLSPRERLNLGALFISMLGAAVLELVSVGAVLPFLTVAGHWQGSTVKPHTSGKLGSSSKG